MSWALVWARARPHRADAWGAPAQECFSAGGKTQRWKRHTVPWELAGAERGEAWPGMELGPKGAACLTAHGHRA